jgi:hypothetical protein
MACRISELVLGCRDPEVLARFWCEVLDFARLDREDDGTLEIGPREGFGGPQPTIILSVRDEPEPGKSPGTYSPIRKATSSACSRPALIRYDGTAG